MFTHDYIPFFQSRAIVNTMSYHSVFSLIIIAVPNDYFMEALSPPTSLLTLQ